MFAAVSVVVVAGVVAVLAGASGSRAPAGRPVAAGAVAPDGGAPAGAPPKGATDGRATSPAPLPAAALGPLRAEPGRAGAGGPTPPVAPGQPRTSGGGAPGGGVAGGGVPAGPGRAGRATHYTLTGLGNCSFPTVPADGRYVALPPSEYAAAGACGSVLDVHGPDGTVRVTVVDLCPECEPGHLDLGVPAFAAIADPVRGIVPITYTRVVNPPLPGPVRVRIKEGSSPFWLSVLLLDTGNPMATVEAAAGSGWRPLVRQPYNYWEAASGVGPGPLTLRVTDDRGHRRTLTGVPLTAGATHLTSVRMY
ncbi:MAG: expansin [Mycobacteriales bacterium]